jgi:hypothetical protein
VEKERNVAPHSFYDLERMISPKGRSPQETWFLDKIKNLVQSRRTKGAKLSKSPKVFNKIQLAFSFIFSSLNIGKR